MDTQLVIVKYTQNQVSGNLKKYHTVLRRELSSTSTIAWYPAHAHALLQHVHCVGESDRLARLRALLSTSLAVVRRDRYLHWKGCMLVIKT